MTAAELEELGAIADLLMGAAHADGRLEPEELDSVREIIGALAEEQDVREQLLARAERFDPQTHDVEACCRRIPLSSARACRSLLVLIGRVVDADGVEDFAESSYLRQVADLIGIDPRDTGDLISDIVSVDGETAPPAPPPVPGGGPAPDDEA